MISELWICESIRTMEGDKSIQNKDWVGPLHLLFNINENKFVN